MIFNRLKWRVLLLVLIGFFFSLSVAVPRGHAEEEGEGKPKAEAEGEGAKKPPKGDNIVTGGRFAGDPIYVHLQPIFVPVITDSGAEQIVTILVDLKVKDMTSADKMHESMPRVRDALMQSLYGGLGSGSLRRGSIVDVTKIKQKIAGAMANLMGEDVIEEVLIQGISQRRL